MIDRITNNIDQMMKAGFLGVIALVAFVYLTDYDGITEMLRRSVEWFGGEPVR